MKVLGKIKTMLDFDITYVVKIGKETKPHSSAQKRYSLDVTEKSGAPVIEDGFIDEYKGKWSTDVFTEKDLKKQGLKLEEIVKLVPKQGGEIYRPAVKKRR